MKNKVYLSLFGMLFLFFSCKKDQTCPEGFSGDNCEIEDFCITQNLECFNGGVCTNGSCLCPDGFSGTHCEVADKNRVQEFLDNSLHPFILFQAGIPLDSFYGKQYEGGLIFYLDTLVGNGIVAAPNDQSTGTEWGCIGTEISGANRKLIGSGLQNTLDILDDCSEPGIAARVCFDLELNGKTDWYLPSRNEIKVLYEHLYARGYGNFEGEAYWSSSEHNHLFAWIQYVEGFAFQVTDNKNYDHFYVRAVRSFDAP